MIELNSSAYPASAIPGPMSADPSTPGRARFQLVSAQPVAAGNELYLRQPISLTFLGFLIALVGTGVATYLQPGAPSGVVSPDTTLIGRLGIVGSTVFVLAACAIVYRAATTRSPAMVPIALLLIGPGAWWNWGLFSSTQPSAAAVSRSVTLLVIVGAAAIAACLLLEATRNTRWLGVYCGLGAGGLAAAALLVRLEPLAADTATLPMMLVVSGLACLYGTLVEIEAVRRQSLEELLKAKARTEAEITQAEDVLHDLRSGLLSIETAIGSFDSDLVGPLRNEAARLRGLTVRSKARPSNFDLVPGLRDLAQARRPAGLMVDVRLPASMVVRGDEGDLLSIVDNLLSNAHRHGRTPIRLEAGEQEGWAWVSVTDSGPRSAKLQPGRLFSRGHSTHPDGQGIGLHRSQMLAEKNHGRLEYDTMYDGGTRFVLSLPAVAQTQFQPVAHQPQPAAQPASILSPAEPQPAPPHSAEPAFPTPTPTPTLPPPPESAAMPPPPPGPPLLEPTPSELSPPGAIPDGLVQPTEPTAKQESEPRPVPQHDPVHEPEPQLMEQHSARIHEPDFDFLADLIPDDPADSETSEPGARQPWTWPEHKSGRPTPPLPPPSMILGAADQSTGAADSGATSVIDLARRTDEVVLNLKSPSEWPTGPVPTQVPGRTTADITGPQSAPAEAL